MEFKLEFSLDELKLLKHEIELRIKSIEKAFQYTNSIFSVDNLEKSLIKAKATLNKITNMIQVQEMIHNDELNNTGDD